MVGPVTDSQQATLVIRTLGPLRIKVNGVELPDEAWPRRKTKELLKILLTSPGDVFTVEQLIEALLPGADVSRAAPNVRARISELRAVLESDLQHGAKSLYIKRIGEGYAFIAGPNSWLDTHIFERDIAAGHRLADEAQWKDAAAALEEGIALYGGDFLAEDRYAEWAQAARAHFQNVYIQALTQLAACYAEIGKLRLAISCCQQVLALEPQRESVVRSLMEYQDSAGYRAQALDTYQEAVQTLMEYLGVDPAPETRMLRDRIRSKPDRQTRLDPRRMAVLPFSNYSSNPEDEYLAEGMTEELIGCLARVRDFRVIARTSVMQYKDTCKSISQIAGELQVGSILEGSVRKVGDKVRISAQLIDSHSEEHLWADEYEGRLGDTLAIQKHAALEVANALKIQLAPDENHALSAQSIGDVTAHTLFLKGRYFLAQRHGTGSPKGRDYLEKATELDPSHARAFAALADAYVMTSEIDLPAEQALARARAAAARAMEIDDSLPEAHAALGLVRLGLERNMLLAKQDLDRAIAVNPSYAVAYDWLGFRYGFLGLYEQAVATYKTAITLDPLSPYHFYLLARALAKLNRFDEAFAALDKAQELNPTHLGTMIRRIAFHQLLHDWDSAEQALEAIRLPHGESGSYHELQGLQMLYRGELSRSQDLLETACARFGTGASARHRSLRHLANSLICARCYDAAIEQLEYVFTENPAGIGTEGHAMPLFYVATALEQLGKYEAALHSLASAEDSLFTDESCLAPWIPTGDSEPGIWVPAATGMVHAALGNNQESFAALENARSCPKNRCGQSARAVLCFRLGLLGEGFEALDLALKNHDWFILTIRTHPWFDPVRHDPRFHDVLKRMNLDN